MPTHAINESPGELHGSSEVKFVRMLPGPVERVWQFLTDPDKRRQWFAGGATDPRPGGKIKLVFNNATLAAPGEEVPEKYRSHAKPGITGYETITRFEPPDVLSHTWDEEGDAPSEVTFELTPEGEEVRLVLTHRRVARPADLADYCGGWHLHLSVLVSKLEESPQPPFWATLERVEADYCAQLGVVKTRTGPCRS